MFHRRLFYAFWSNGWFGGPQASSRFVFTETRWGGVPGALPVAKLMQIIWCILYGLCHTGWWWLEPWNLIRLSINIENVIIPTDKLIYFRGVETTNQYIYIYVYLLNGVISQWQLLKQKIQHPAPSFNAHGSNHFTIWCLAVMLVHKPHHMGMDQYLLYNTNSRGMNIHLPTILMFTRGTRFWHTAI